MRGRHIPYTNDHYLRHGRKGARHLPPLCPGLFRLGWVVFVRHGVVVFVVTRAFGWTATVVVIRPGLKVFVFLFVVVVVLLLATALAGLSVGILRGE